MFQRIREHMGYDMGSMRDDQPWLVQALLGYGLPGKDTRRRVGEAVTTFLAAAMRLRARSLKPIGDGIFDG